ncbi:MAG: PepSY domain-containing protein [Pseudomonadales bacterium]
MLLRAMLLLTVVLCAGCEIFDFEDEQEIDLKDVPQAAMTSAQAAVEGIEFTFAETEVEKGVTVYALKGMAGGQDYEVEVTAEGEVLEIETD